MITKEDECEKRDQILREDLFEPVMWEWASTAVLATNKNEKLRFRVVYRTLNASTVRDTYQLPRMDEGIDSLLDAAMFSIGDCTSGYWHTKIPDVDRFKTTYSSHHVMVSRLLV